MLTYYQPASPSDPNLPALRSDLCVYAATAAGVIGALSARRQGLTVTLLNPGWHIGGMTTGGLSFTDLGNTGAIGGLAREFYRAVGAHYGKPEEWKFEPHVATQVLRKWLADAGIEVLYGQYVGSVAMKDGRIHSLRTTSGLEVRSAYYLDCSYEGDLMALAGAKFAVGREGNAAYGEHFNGQQVHATHQFQHRIDPYVAPGLPGSGLLKGIDADSSLLPGQGDRRVQAYNFRLCMTRRDDLRVNFSRPAEYDRPLYELHARCFAAGARETFAKFDDIQNGKADVNNHGACSTDLIGGSWEWPTAPYAQREKLFQAHVNYQQGYHWFMCSDPAVPAETRAAYSRWGLAGDEFTDTGHWPPQLYVREGRRLVGAVVMTEKHCFSQAVVEDPVGLAAYTMDSHNCRRFVHEGMVLNEGNVEVKLPRPYGISYRAIVVPESVCANLAVPVCLSASHIAYGSIRMEPVFMILAQSAVAAIAIALRSASLPLSQVPYSTLKARLDQEGQVVGWQAGRWHNPADVNG